MALDDEKDKREWALDALRTAPVESELWHAAGEYLHMLFVEGQEK